MDKNINYYKNLKSYPHGEKIEIVASSVSGKTNIFFFEGLKENIDTLLLMLKKAIAKYSFFTNEWVSKAAKLCDVKLITVR